MKYLITLMLLMMTMTSQAETIIKAVLEKDSPISVASSNKINEQTLKFEPAQFPEKHYAKTPVLIRVKDVKTDDPQIKAMFDKKQEPKDLISVMAHVEILDYNKIQNTYKMQFTLFETFVSDVFQRYLVTADFGNGQSSIVATGKFQKIKKYFDIDDIKAPLNETFKAAMLDDGQIYIIFVPQKNMPVTLRLKKAAS